MIQQIWNFITSMVPVERWVRSIGNMLQLLGYVFILLFALVFFLIVGTGPFTPVQRIDLIRDIFRLMLWTVILSVLLALISGGLYNPQERSLNRGRKYGTQTDPKRRAEVQKEPAEPANPALPAPSDKKPLPNHRETQT